MTAFDFQQISPVIVGELGGANDRIQRSIGEISFSYTADGASQLELAINDEDLEMHNAGYFVIRRNVRYREMRFEIAAVEVQAGAGDPERVRVTCRSRAVQRLKRQKGAKNFGKISPTSFALQMANAVGLEFFGESSPAKDAIIRAANDNNDESSWDVLRRLAADLEFIVFEDGEILYFASEKYLIKKQPTITVTWPPTSRNTAFYPHSVQARRSDDDVHGSEIEVVIDRTNATQIRPGMGLRLNGLEYFDKKHMITSVEYHDNSPTPVSIRARTPEISEDAGGGGTETGCTTQTFRQGDTGACVKRIQQAVGVTADGIFGPITEAAVKSFQTEHGLTANGIVGPETWEKIVEET